jgi:hypothetical protein
MRMCWARFDFRSQQYVAGIMEEEVVTRPGVGPPPVSSPRHFLLYLYDRGSGQVRVLLAGLRARHLHAHNLLPGPCRFRLEADCSSTAEAVADEEPEIESFY